MRRWRPRTADRGGLADECDAFLRGRSAEHAHDVGWVVEPWAWVNELAHRRPDELRTLAAGLRPRSRQRSWSRAVDAAAALLVEWARDDLDLERWQLEVLVPLELELLAGAPPPHPDDLVRDVLGRVVRHRRATPRVRLSAG